MKYKVGDKVKIRKDLIDEENYGSVNFVEPMEEYKGQTAEITMTYDDGKDGYLIDIDGGVWYWSAEMFEKEIRYINFDYGITYRMGIYDSCYKKVSAKYLEEALYDIFIHGGCDVKINCIEIEKEDRINDSYSCN